MSADDDAAAQITEDFRTALEDMKTVMRIEIMTLCQIARENTAYALDISETLQNYILEAAPQRKLPALYVLDAIVKHVGTPYTLYLAPKLYRMFMEAYATADSHVRQKMDEMLVTWKRPVPGSIDTRPVFPLEVVEPIEKALSKAFSSAAQAQQRLSSARPRSMRPSPVPQDRPFMPPQQPQSAVHMRRTVSRDTGTPINASFLNVPNMPPAAPTIPQLAISVDSLIRNLQISESRLPHDHTITPKIRTLIDLKGLFDSGSELPLPILLQIKQLVDDLTASTNEKYGYLFAPPPQPPVPAKVNLESLFGATMAALLKRSTPTPKPSVSSSFATPSPACGTPVPPAAPAAMRVPQHGIPQAAPIVPVMTQSATPTLVSALDSAPAPAPVAPSVYDTMSLMMKLRQKGILPSTPGSQQHTSQSMAPKALQVMAPQASRGPQVPQIPGTPVLPPIIAKALAAQRQQQMSQPKSPEAEKDEITLDAVSLKADRSHLLPSMLNGLGKPCSRCGRRFLQDDIGNKKRVSHMDWHFNTHQRRLNAEKRGQHRSWYLDGKAWLAYRESVDAELPEATPAATSTPVAPQVQYIPVPDPSEGVNLSCPICADKFVNKWSDAAQEWVWMDTIRVNNKAYHASCYGEAFRPRNAPEPILGKRKAESPVAAGLLSIEGKKWRAEVS